MSMGINVGEIFHFYKRVQYYIRHWRERRSELDYWFIRTAPDRPALGSSEQATLHVFFEKLLKDIPEV